MEVEWTQDPVKKKDGGEKWTGWTSVNVLGLEERSKDDEKRKDDEEVGKESG